MSYRTARVLAAASLALPLAAGSPVAAKGGGAPCSVVDFSPAFALDRTAMCAHQSAAYDDDARTWRLGPIEVYATTDAGRTWRKQPATGLPEVKTNDTGSPPPGCRR